MTFGLFAELGRGRLAVEDLRYVGELRGTLELTPGVDHHGTALTVGLGLAICEVRTE